LYTNRLLNRLIAGVILSKGSDWISQRITTHPPEKENEYESIDMNLSSEIITEFEEILCPNCGFIDDGLYCSKYGSQLR
jgi:hypothetical protein